MTPEQRADEIEKAWVRFTPKWPGVRTLIVNAIREAEAAALREAEGLRAAYSLMQKGMGSMAELQDGLKQEVRTLREENARLLKQNGPAAP